MGQSISIVAAARNVRPLRAKLTGHEPFEPSMSHSPPEATASSPGAAPNAATAPAPHRSRPLAGALALFLGATGAHRLYLGARYWWIYPLIALPALGIALNMAPWFRSPAFFVAVIVVLVTMLEAIVFGLTPDAKWDERYNPRSGRASANRWAPVLIAIVALALGATLMMSVLAIALESYFDSLRAL